MQLTHIPAQTLSVTDHLLPAISDLNALSAAKMTAARDASFIYHAINANVDGVQHYYVECGDDHDQFTLPAGDYAAFSMTRGNRLALDQFIAHAYAGLAAEGYRPAGNYNLETLSATTFTIQIPVVAA